MYVDQLLLAVIQSLFRFETRLVQISLIILLGAHGGAYSIYRSLAIAMGELDALHKPNLINTEPVVNIGPFPSWYVGNCVTS